MHIIYITASRCEGARTSEWHEWMTRVNDTSDRHEWMTLQYRIAAHIHRMTWHDNAHQADDVTFRITHITCHVTQPGKLSKGFIKQIWRCMADMSESLTFRAFRAFLSIPHIAHVAHKLATGRKRMARKHPQARAVCKQAQARVVCKYLLLTLLSSTKKWPSLSQTTCRITYDIATEITCDITQVGKLSKGGFHSIGLKAYGVQVSRVPLHTATHCHTLQRTATHCNALQHTATHCNTLPHTATHCHTLPHTVAHSSTQQHTAAHSGTQQDKMDMKQAPMAHSKQPVVHCSVLQHQWRIASSL